MFIIIDIMLQNNKIASRSLMLLLFSIFFILLTHNHKRLIDVHFGCIIIPVFNQHKKK